MRTYQDLIDCGQDEELRIDFVINAIMEHKASQAYKIAEDALLYYKHLNPTIMRAQKFMYDLQGKAVPDYYSANNKIPCRYYFYFITQAVQYLLGNGVSFGDDATKDQLGKNFDNAIQTAATQAMNGGVSFLFWNVDHVEVYPLAGGDEPSFVPLYDEENGALRAGVRFWQVAPDRPMRATLYEEDGMTEYIKQTDSDMVVLEPKKDYVQIVETSEVSGTTIYNGGNYPNFPIVPLFNVNKQSELIGSKETLDAYDLMASNLINNVDDGNLIYWVLKNMGGMDDIDDVKFVERLKTLHVAHADGDADGSIEPHTLEAPFGANENALERLKTQLFDDFMALDVKQIASGAVTATQIKAAYEPLNAKADMFEYQVTEAIEGILALIGIDDEPSYTRSMIANKSEEVQTLLQSAEYLSDDYVTRKIIELYGDIDKVEDILAQRQEEEMNRYQPEDGEQPDKESEDEFADDQIGEEAEEETEADEDVEAGGEAEEDFGDDEIEALISELEDELLSEDEDEEDDEIEKKLKELEDLLR